MMDEEEKENPRSGTYRKIDTDIFSRCAERSIQNILV